MAVRCSTCRAESIPFVIPETYRDVSPVDTQAAAACRVCLTVDPYDGSGDDSVSPISDALPADRDTAAGVVLLIGLMESLALNRQAIESLVQTLESEGVDVLLVLRRLADDPDIRPAIDLGRRIHQVEQLLE